MGAIPPPFPILIARPAHCRRLGGMGAKYLPTVKDAKADKRFQQKQTGVPNYKKSAGDPPAKPAKKK